MGVLHWLFDILCAILVHHYCCKVTSSHFHFTSDLFTKEIILRFSAEVAKHLEDDSFGLVFGINTFVAVLLQSILTVTVVANEVLALTIFQQFTVYAVYFFALAAIYLAAFIVNLVRSCRLKNSTKDESLQPVGNE